MVAAASLRPRAGVKAVPVPAVRCRGGVTCRAAAGPATASAPVPLQLEGYETWSWARQATDSPEEERPGEVVPQKVGYIQAGTAGPPLLLVHGFGASSYHWRFNINELARTNRVFAVDLLGFGWSVIALASYAGGDVWAAQLCEFIEEVIGTEEKVYVAGNSLGGFAALCAANRDPSLFAGVCLLNSAGRFRDEMAADDGGEASEGGEALATVLEALKRFFIKTVAFQFSKTPAQVKRVLESVYGSMENVDDDLVTSILAPAQDPNASEVCVVHAMGVPCLPVRWLTPGTGSRFYRIVSRNGGQAAGKGKKQRSVDDLVERLVAKGIPLSFIW